MRIAVGILVVLTAVIAGIIYLNNRSDSQAPMSNAPTVQGGVVSQTPASETVAPQQPGAYIDYSDSVIANTAGTKILFFHAPWCPQCRALDASIKSGQISSNVTIIKADYDTNQQLRKKYGVTIQTTLVKVDDNGNLVEKYVAYDEPTLAAVNKNLL